MSELQQAKQLILLCSRMHLSRPALLLDRPVRHMPSMAKELHPPTSCEASLNSRNHVNAMHATIVVQQIIFPQLDLPFPSSVVQHHTTVVVTFLQTYSKS